MENERLTVLCCPAVRWFRLAVETAGLPPGYYKRMGPSEVLDGWISIRSKDSSGYALPKYTFVFVEVKKKVRNENSD